MWNRHKHNKLKRNHKEVSDPPVKQTRMFQKGLIVFILLLASAWAVADNSLPPILQNVGIEQRLNDQVPLNLKFKDENGANVELQKYFTGKPVILTLVYYKCPMLCTEVLNGTVKAMKVLEFQAGKEFDVVTVSFNPKETPRLASDKKQMYLESYGKPGAAAGWHFLTGAQDSIQRLTNAVGFKYKYDPIQDQFAHAASIMILTPQGRISRYLYGVEFAPRDLRLALVEASEGKIGSPVDRALLFCFHYDPTTGKYSAYVLNLVRLGGVVTVLCIGVFIVVMKKKEKYS